MEGAAPLRASVRGAGRAAGEQGPLADAACRVAALLRDSCPEGDGVEKKGPCRCAQSK